jgi:hypothetical protein
VLKLRGAARQVAYVLTLVELRASLINLLQPDFYHYKIY